MELKAHDEAIWIKKESMLAYPEFSEVFISMLMPVTHRLVESLCIMISP